MEEPENLAANPLGEDSSFVFLTEDSISSESVKVEVKGNPVDCLENGKSLSKPWKKKFAPATQACKPLQEVDPAYNGTFLVIGKGGTISRLPTSRSLFLLGPLNPLRKLAIFLTTHFIFHAFMVLVILFNVCTLNLAREGGAYVYDYPCVLIYLTEFILKVLSRGLVLDSFTCLRILWNWLDVFVLASYFLNLDIVRPTGLHIFLIIQWFRIFKIIPLIKVMREEFSHLSSLLCRLTSVIFYTFFSLCVLSTLGVLIYMGLLTQKCIKNSPIDLTDAAYETRMNNSTYWFQYENNGYEHCGNISSSFICPEGYTCLQGYGGNQADHGFTNFDTFPWAFLQSSRIVGQDYLENILIKLVSAGGSFQTHYLIFSYFFGTFAIGAMLYGIIGEYLLRSFKNPFENNERVKRSDSDTDTATLPITSSQSEPQSQGQSSTMKVKMQNLAKSEGLEYFITITIIVDNLLQLFLMNADEYENQKCLSLLTIVQPFAILIIYSAEFKIKVIAAGPKKYFQNRWNIFDFFITLCTLVHIFLDVFEDGFVPGLQVIRFFKIVPRWDGLLNVFKIFFALLKGKKGLIGLAVSFLAFFTYVGHEAYEYDYVARKYRYPDEEISRWNFLTVQSSFLQVFRSWSKETIETIWDCMHYGGYSCSVYFLIVHGTGIFFTTVFIVNVVLLTNSIMKRETEKESTLTKMGNFVRKPCKIICEKLSKPSNTKQDVVEAEPMKGDEKDNEAGEGKEKKKVTTKGYRLKMRDCLENKWVNLISILVIIGSSVVYVAVSLRTSRDWKWLSEIVFLSCFIITTVYKLVAVGFKECFGVSLTFDLVIIAESLFRLVMEMSQGVTPLWNFFFFIHSLRPLMLVSRTARLSAVFTTLKDQLLKGFSYIYSVSFIWICFALWFHEIFRFKFFSCFDPTTKTSIQLGKMECLANNMTWINAMHNFDSTSDSLISLIAFGIRNGWILIMNDMRDSTRYDQSKETDYRSTFAIFLLVVFYFFGVLLSYGVVAGVFAHQIRKKKSFFTEEQLKLYEKEQEEGSTAADILTRPESAFRGKMFDLATSKGFSWGIMFTIIFSFVYFSYDHFNMSDEELRVMNIIHYVIVILLFIEVCLKLVAVGKQFFTSKWNIYDLFTLVINGLGLLLSELLEKYFLSPILFLFFRILRLIQFPPLLNKLPALKTFFFTLSTMSPVLRNILLFHLMIMLSYIMLGMSLFGHLPTLMEGSETINFQSASASFRALFCISTIAGTDGIYQSLGKEYDCSEEEGTCGDRKWAAFFVFSYLFISLYLTLNFYLCFILEFVNNLGKDARKEEEVERKPDIEMVETVQEEKKVEE